MPEPTRIDDVLSRIEDAERRGLPAVPEQFCDGDAALLAEVNRRRQALREMAAALVTAPLSSGEGDALDVPGYEILGELGRGGMGVVYQARQVRAGRVVALKVAIGGAPPGSAERARFQQEVLAASRLQHPNVARVYEVGEAQGRPFFSMEFCPGGSLADRIRARPLAPRAAAALVGVLARAVQYAHEQGVIHRDVKPANVLIGPNGELKLADFGLARSPEGAGLTLSGAVLGTPSYLAPEQARGDKNVGPAADVWALGATLYECLTGRPPFKAATTHETLVQVLGLDPVAPRVLQPNTPRDLETVCLKCLQKETHKRYRSAAEMADDLYRFLDGRAITARPVGAAERGRRWCARNRALAAALLAVALSLLAGTLLSSVLALSASRHAGNAEKMATRAEANEKDAVRLAQLAEKRTIEAKQETHKADLARRQADWLVYTRGVALGLRDRHEGDLAGARQALETAPAEPRHWEHAHLAELLAPVRWVGRQRGEVTDVAFAPDGREFASGAREVTVFDARTGEPVRKLQMTNATSAVRFSPDGKWLAAGDHSGTVRVWDRGGKERFSVAGQGAVHRLAFDRASERIAAGGEGGVWVRPLAGGKTTTLHLGGDDKYRVGAMAWPSELIVLDGRNCRAWDVKGEKKLSDDPAPKERNNWHRTISPDGKHLATTDGRDVVIWDRTFVAPKRRLTGHAGDVLTMTFSADGGRIASTDGTSVRIHELAGGRELFAFRGHLAPVTALAFSPDGKALISGAADGSFVSWDLTAPRGLFTFATGMTTSLHCVGFTPGGEAMTFCGEALWLADAAAGGARTLKMPGNLEDVVSTCLSPGGRHAAVQGKEGKLLVWPHAGGRDPFALPDQPGMSSCFVFGRDRKGDALLAGTFYTYDDKRGASPIPGVRVWDVGAHRLVATLGKDEPHSAVLAFSPGAGRLALGGETGLMKVYDLATRREVFSLEEKGPFACLAFSPDGRLLASSVAEQVVLMDATTGREMVRLSGHTAAVRGLAFSPDGRRLATASRDRSVRLWDVPSRREVLALRDATHPLRAVAFSADGRRLAAVCDGGTLWVWSADRAFPAKPAGR